MNKENIKVGIVVLISCGIPAVVQRAFGPSPYMLSPGMLYVLWAVINFLFITTVSELSSQYTKVFKLKKLKMQKMTFFVNLIVYYSFLIFINLYFTQQIFIRDNQTLNKFTSVYILIVILIAYLLNLNSGQFPEENETDSTKIYNMREKGPFKFGKEKFATLIGEYEDGFVMGVHSFKYEDIKNIYNDKKQDSLVIKGKDEEGNFRISVAAEKSKKELKDILLKANKENKLVNGQVNL